MEGILYVTQSYTIKAKDERKEYYIMRQGMSIHTFFPPIQFHRYEYK